MAGFNTPGALCAASNGAVIDTGTGALCASPTPGPVGAQRRAPLDRDDPEVAQLLALLEGFGRGPHPLSGGRLKTVRARQVSLLIDAAFEFGPQSKAVRLQQLTIDAIDGWIRNAEFRDFAARLPDRLEVVGREFDELLERAERPDGGGVSLAELAAATTRYAELARSTEQVGGGANNPAVNRRLLRSIELARSRHRAEILDGLDKFRRGSGVFPLGPLQAAVTGLLGDQRMRELLGGGDDDGEVIALAAEVAHALQLASDRALGTPP